MHHGADADTFDRVTFELESWQYPALERLAFYVGTTADSALRAILTQALYVLGWGPLSDGLREVQPARAVIGGAEPALLDQPATAASERRRRSQHQMQTTQRKDSAKEHASCKK